MAAKCCADRMVGWAARAAMVNMRTGRWSPGNAQLGRGLLTRFYLRWRRRCTVSAHRLLFLLVSGSTVVQQRLRGARCRKPSRNVCMYPKANCRLNSANRSWDAHPSTRAWQRTLAPKRRAVLAVLVVWCALCGRLFAAAIGCTGLDRPGPLQVVGHPLRVPPGQALTVEMRSNTTVTHE